MTPILPMPIPMLTGMPMVVLMGVAMVIVRTGMRIGRDTVPLMTGIEEGARSRAGIMSNDGSIRSSMGIICVHVYMSA
jgi:hypothetical protein